MARHEAVHSASITVHDVEHLGQAGCVCRAGPLNEVLDPAGSHLVGQHNREREHSERKVLKTDRIRKILLSATKQSLKGAIPQISEPESVSAFIRSHRDTDELKLIAYCFEEEDAPRISIKDVLAEETPAGAASIDPAAGQPARPIVILIGPEGDFSRAEASLALECGFRPIHLGESRLRTETAALTAVEAVYFHYM